MAICDFLWPFCPSEFKRGISHPWLQNDAIRSRSDRHFSRAITPLFLTNNWYRDTSCFASRWANRNWQVSSQSWQHAKIHCSFWQRFLAEITHVITRWKMFERPGLDGVFLKLFSVTSGQVLKCPKVTRKMHESPYYTAFSSNNLRPLPSGIWITVAKSSGLILQMRSWARSTAAYFICSPRSTRWRRFTLDHSFLDEQFSVIPHKFPD